MASFLQENCAEVFMITSAHVLSTSQISYDDKIHPMFR